MVLGLWHSVCVFSGLISILWFVILVLLVVFSLCYIYSFYSFVFYHCAPHFMSSHACLSPVSIFCVSFMSPQSAMFPCVFPPKSCFILTVPWPLFSVFGFASSLPHYVGQTWMTRIQPIDIAIERNMFDVTHYISVCFGVVRHDQEEAKNVQNPPKKVNLVWVEFKPRTFFLWCNITVPTHHAIKPKY